MAAALMLGAEGAWIGTAFLATPEAGIPDFQKQALLASDASTTLVSRAVTGKPVRLLRGSWVAAWEASGLEALPMPYQSAVAAPVLTAAALGARGDVDPGIAGQGWASCARSGRRPTCSAISSRAPRPRSGRGRAAWRGERRARDGPRLSR